MAKPDQMQMQFLKITGLEACHLVFDFKDGHADILRRVTFCVKERVFRLEGQG
ncbi:hypothetical protein OPIT5_20205 [Opitutaceae bacterium TAV5]|nr:hypothetical protein OPIT5_20205 [Opitutaceae bacterium TAV5]